MRCIACKTPYDKESCPTWWELRAANGTMGMLFCCLEELEYWLKMLPYGDERDEGRTDLNGVVNDEDILRY